MDSHLRKKESELLCKLDIEKAYGPSVGTSCSRFWREWASAENGLVGLSGAYPQPLSHFFLLALLWASSGVLEA